MTSKIDHSLFSAHEQALEHEPCPMCGSNLILKHSKRGPFLGCSNYPECEYIKPRHQNDGHVVKALGIPCPECEHELVLRQGRYGMFIGCSNYPQCHHIEKLDQQEPADSTESECACPECSTGHLIKRKNRFGKVFYACDNYPKCKFAVNLPPIQGKCEKCGFGLLIEKKLASGIKRQCADRKCHHTQSQQQ